MYCKSCLGSVTCPPRRTGKIPLTWHGSGRYRSVTQQRVSNAIRNYYEGCGPLKALDLKYQLKMRQGGMISYAHVALNRILHYENAVLGL